MKLIGICFIYNKYVYIEDLRRFIIYWIEINLILKILIDLLLKIRFVMYWGIKLKCLVVWINLIYCFSFIV